VTDNSVPAVRDLCVSENVEGP